MLIKPKKTRRVFAQSLLNPKIYIHDVYTQSIHKMEDVFNTTILCNNCNQATKKSYINKDGFKIRTMQCDSCKKEWYHPGDMQDYENFSRLRNKCFQVKLRYVGNSYAISIPREIIQFEEEMQREINEMIQMSLESPERVSITFSKKIKHILK